MVSLSHSVWGQLRLFAATVQPDAWQQRQKGQADLLGLAAVAAVEEAAAVVGLRVTGPVTDPVDILGNAVRVFLALKAIDIEV